MARPTDRNRARKDAEARFPIKIDLRRPSIGEPWPGAWAQHGFMDRKRRDERGIPPTLPGGTF